VSLEVRQRTVTKKEAALRQITAAIEHYNKGEYECAITLAGAAEGQLTVKDADNHLFKQLKERVPPEFKDERDWASWLNATRDWLKHETPQWGDQWVISDYSAGIMISRAITKFNRAYGQVTQRMLNFDNDWRKLLADKRTDERGNLDG
jgi:hypothetical protein